jgi:tetratricopeptide (TPR) repeat protein
MTPGQNWMVGLLSAATVGLLLAGCQTTQHQAREQAQQRWNAARAQLKAKLAADQFEAGNIAAAAGELTEACRLDPGNLALVPLRAKVCLAEGKLAAAEELLEQACQQSPPQAEIEYLLGVVRQQQQRWQEALAAFLRAAEIDPNEAAYVAAAVQVWLQLGEPQEGLGLLLQAAPRLGFTGAYQAALAECYEQLGDWPAAASAWQRAVSGADAEADLRQRLAEALFRAGRHAEAIPVLRELLGEQGAPATCQAPGSVASALCGRRMATQSVAMAPGNPEAAGATTAETAIRLMLAECYLAQGESTAARQQVELALRREPEDARCLRLLARCWAAAGDYQAAMRAARRAWVQDGRDVQTLELLAALAWRTGDSELVASSIAQLVELDPENPVAQRIRQQTASPIPSPPAD